MPRSFCLERDPDSKSSGSIRSSHPESRPLDGIRSSHPDSNPFDNTRRTQPPSKEQMTNQELVQHNQKLQTRVQKLTTAYQAVEQQNVMLRDRCLRLQNRVDELKEHLAAIKVQGMRTIILTIVGWCRTASCSDAARCRSLVWSGHLPWDIGSKYWYRHLSNFYWDISSVECTLRSSYWFTTFELGSHFWICRRYCYCSIATQSWQKLRVSENPKM